MAFPSRNAGATLVLVSAHFRAVTRSLALFGFSSLSVTYIFVQRDAGDVGRIRNPMLYSIELGDHTETNDL
jgi:hypothetical protein